MAAIAALADSASGVCKGSNMRLFCLYEANGAWYEDRPARADEDEDDDDE